MNPESIVAPTSIIDRFFSAEFGQPAPGATKVEHWLDVVKEAKTIDGKGLLAGEQPGRRPGPAPEWNPINGSPSRLPGRAGRSSSGQEPSAGRVLITLPG
jgi:hypothetical protein